MNNSSKILDIEVVDNKSCKDIVENENKRRKKGLYIYT